jgi:secretion/DNA translocation related TadE-like protein
MTTISAGDDGSVSVVVAAIALVILVMTMGLADVAHTLTVRAKARTAADAAALAAAQELAFPGGEDPVAIAATYAQRNGAEMIDCKCSIGTFDAVVSVRIEVHGLVLVPGSHEVVVTSRAIVDLP